MKRITLIATALLVSVSLMAQEEARQDTFWTVSGVTSLNLSQLALSNWAAGGENNVSGNVLIQFSGDYDNGSLNWDNDLTLGYGLVKQGEDPARKSDDQIDLSSKLGYRASERWLYSGLVSFKTQFDEGYDNPGDANRNKISNFMAPGYLNISAGMDYKPDDNFSLFISPVTGKMTFVMDEELSAAGAFGVDSAQNIRAELGAFLKMAFAKEILKNVTLDTKIGLFSNYLENPQYVDVSWDLLLTFKVNEYISATLMTQLIYDYDIKFGPNADEARVQFKELFGLGLTYNF